MRPFHVHALIFALLCGWAGAATVTTRADAVGKLLNEWFEAGTASGLSGITYENRDLRHSLLGANLYPQLKMVITPEGDHGPARVVRGYPVIGNCSMASPPDQVGSLPRLYMTDPGGSMFLAQQYLSNNLFIYPEHLDHDAGGNGVGGYGDLFPLNTPAMLITQGSSFTDMPFVNAFLSATAAFRPETRKVLLERKLLAPTLQAIFRHSNKNAATDADYVKGAAHPVVFDSAQLDEEKMIRMAHDMTPETIPPVSIIEVMEETKLQNGVHFFETAAPGPNNFVQISQSPVSIGRIFRGNVSQMGMVVNVGKSFSALPKKIGVRFALLQGDPRCVSIEQQPDAPIARIRVRWQPPVAGARLTRSHRIDIGVFTTDGKMFGAPSFISFYMLPNEMHFYDAEGRVSEVQYQTFNPESGLPNENRDLRWARVLQTLVSGDAPAPLQRVIDTVITPAELAALKKVHADLKQRVEAVATVARDEKLKAEADKLRNAALDRIAEALDKPLTAEKPRTPRYLIALVLDAVLSDPLFYIRQQGEISPLASRSSKPTAAADVRAEIHRLTLLGILRQNSDGAILTASPPADLSLGEKMALRGLNLTVLSQLLMPDALERSPAPAWAPPRLTTIKPWRDVMHYDTASGRLSGWTRYHDARRSEFDAEGRLLPPAGNSAPVPVTYVIDTDGRLTWRPEKK